MRSVYGDQLATVVRGIEMSFVRFGDAVLGVKINILGKQQWIMRVRMKQLLLAEQPIVRVYDCIVNVEAAS